ncbi:16S rRNA (cytosine(1402)-N(4))-methyltransferase RsmH [Candidatus Peregrinibacteria bacterium]|nr:16S rRNA (cytosine(1402)-N(4))-methyltransferase RsmH [Candidatus Peregrinibacteria bacterium]
MKTDYTHTPVLPEETIDLLNLKAGSSGRQGRTGMRVVDCTLGLGGHSREILKKIGPKGRLLAIEQDEENLIRAKKNLKGFSKRITFVHDNFENLAAIVKKYKFGPVNAILFDLGLSSPHLEKAERGFAFRHEGPLDMRFDKRQGLTAADVVNSYREQELTDILRQYGEEPKARFIAQAIIRERKKRALRTTSDLVKVVETVYRRRSPKFHPATLTFQALRIYVNRELETLKKALEQAINLLAPKGRIAVISYHSLEDRIVKIKFRHYTRSCICPKELPICQCNFQKLLYIVTKKPIIPTGIEVLANPRSRSAKLRAAEKL